MKKYLFILMAVLMLVACGNDKEPEEVIADDESESNESETVKEFDEVVADDENITATLEDVTVTDDEFGKRYNVNIKIENKSDETVDISVDEFSINDEMADDIKYYNNDPISGKKSGNTVIYIDNDDMELSDVKEMQFNLEIAKDMELQNSHEIQIDL